MVAFRSEDPEAEDVGHKWTLSALLRHMRAEGKDTSLLMRRVEDVIVKAILAAAPTIVAAARFVPHPNNCFGMFSRLFNLPSVRGSVIQT